MGQIFYILLCAAVGFVMTILLTRDINLKSMQNSKNLRIAILCVTLVAVFAIGRFFSFQDLKAQVRDNEARLDVAQKQLVEMKGSCDLLLYGG